MFKIDRQTLADLNALDWNSASLLRFFDHTLTLGGRDMLYSWFVHPLDQVKEIVARQQAIAYLASVNINKLFDKYMMVDLERYLATPGEFHSGSQFMYYVDKLSSNFLSLHYQRDRLLIKQSVAEIASIFVKVYDILHAAKIAKQPIGLLQQFYVSLADFLTYFDIVELRDVARGKNATRVILRCDYLFRSQHKNLVQQLFQILYTLDALYAVAKASRQVELSFPIIKEAQESNSLLEIDDLYNLAIAAPVKNMIRIYQSKNIWFLTGANMTGKSTLLKSIGSCLYLAHLGFPVPASRLEMSLFDGIMTNINLADNMASGFSHFFAEVHRVKAMGQAIAEGKRMVIMLDELFKGTNYQDAYEATLGLIESLHGVSDSLFFISTHITDLGVVLEQHERVALKYLKTEADDKEGVRFTYKLADGLATEKLGMWFLKRERVFETFFAIKSNLK